MKLIKNTLKLLSPEQRAIITNIEGSDSFRTFLLSNGISIGTIFFMNYSPSYTMLINLTIGSKMLSLRKDDFLKIGWVLI